ncbi:MAG: endonuclease [Flavobacteriaceae bacterium]|nr:endonuclease [Flavobacteriaceae bacterium]
MNIKILVASAALLVLAACGGDSTETPKPSPEPTPENNAPGDFTATVKNITIDQATISWSNAIDPDGDTVNYTVKQGAVSSTSLSGNTHTFAGLTDGTNYNGTVTANDGNGGTNTANYTFKTEAKPTSNPGAFVIPSALASYYKDMDFTKIDMPLFDDLAVLTISKHNNILDYGERHNHLYGADKDPNNSANVLLIYSGDSVDKREYLSGNNSYSPQTFNTEHLYPQSKLGNGNAVGDLHHLRTCNHQINSSRSNYPFTDGSGTYNLKNGAWYPGDEWRGDVARMILYVNLRYDEPLNGDISTSGINLFLKWNREDPVSAIEIQRNNVIQNSQGNRNPFIDNPYLVTVIFGGEAAENRWAD